MQHAQERCPPESRSEVVAAQCISALCRYVLAGAALLVPASVITATSCADLNCGAKCENTGGAAVDCRSESTAECLSFSTCSVRTACFCSGVSSSNPMPKGCNGAACYVAKDQDQCAGTIGCEWADSCDDLVVFDCHTMDLDETACRQNPRCTYHKDCG